VEELGDTQTLYSAACANAAGNTTALATAECTRWRISNVTTVFTPSRNVDQSLWQLQIGLRYEW
jgi:hypothetical protein